MSSCGPPAPLPIIIDLISDDDDDDVPASSITDLTSVGHPPISFHVSHEPEVKVEDESSTLVDSSTANSGDSSPNTQQDNGIAQSESNPTDVGDLSPRHAQDPGGSSSDDDLTLGAILARSKKRKHDSGDAHTSESRSNDMPTALPPTALNLLVGSQSLKPNFNNFFSVHKQVVNETHSEKSRQAEKSRTPRDESGSIQKGTHSAKNPNPHILNIVREEVFGQETEKKKKKKKKKKQRSHPSSQQESGKKHIQVDGQAFSTPAPPRAVSEAPETVRPKKKIEHYGVMRPSKAREEAESERPSKRRKHNDCEDTASGSTSFAAASNTTKSQAVFVGKPQGHKPKKLGVERSHSAGKDKATEKPRGFSRFRPGDHRHSRVEKTTSHESRRKEHHARAREKAHKSKHVGSFSQRGEKAYMVADQNEQGNWAPSGFQTAVMASQNQMQGRLKGIVDSGRDVSLQAHEEPCGIDSGTAGTQLPLERNTGHTTPLGGNEFISEVQEQPNVDLQQTHHEQTNDGRQESPQTQSILNTALPAHRVKQIQQTMRLDDKDLEKARNFFSNHPSNLTQQRKTTVLASLPPDVVKPSYRDRRQMVIRNTGKKSGRKVLNLNQRARKREQERQQRVVSKRKQLEVEANQRFPNESKERKQKWVEDGIAKLRQIFAKNDQKREEEKSQGLLTVEDLEELGMAGGDPMGRPSAGAQKRKRHGIPIEEALEPGATMNLYVVYMSELVEKGQEFRGDGMKRLGDQFLRKQDANTHAEKVLRDGRLHDSPLLSMQFRVGPEDGLFVGIKDLANGKQVMCMVQREKQMASKLDLRDISVHKGLKEMYIPRYDVWCIDLVPQVFLKEEEGSVDGDKGKKPKSKTPTTDLGEERPEPGEQEHEDGDNDSLFSSPPPPEPEDAPDESAETEDEDDDSDNDSVATDVTLKPSEPGGNLGKLSLENFSISYEHVGAFTTLELANEKAYKAALEHWKPKSERLDPWLHYLDNVKKKLDETWDKGDLDLEPAEHEFTVPEFEGHIKHRPWLFTHSKVYVTESTLEGPRDIGNYIATGDGEEDGGEDGEGEGNGEND